MYPYILSWMMVPTVITGAVLTLHKKLKGPSRKKARRIKPVCLGRYTISLYSYNWWSSKAALKVKIPV